MNKKYIISALVLITSIIILVKSTRVYGVHLSLNNNAINEYWEICEIPDTIEEAVYNGELHKDDNAKKQEIYDLRIGIQGGIAVPVGEVSKILNPGYGGSAWISSNIAYMRFLPFFREPEMNDIIRRSHLIFECGYYYSGGQSIRNYEGKDIRAGFIPFLFAYAYMLPLKISENAEIRFMPKLGFGISRISATIGTATVQCNDFTLIPGLITAYNINHTIQVFLDLDYFMFFEQEIGMQIRTRMGVNYLLF